MPKLQEEGEKKIDLFYGDCLSLLPSLADESAAAIITDPPYGIGYHSNHYKVKNPHAPVANDWNFQPSAFFQECMRVLKDGGALYLFCRWDVQPLWLPVLNGCGLKVKNVIAWVKDNWSAGDLDGNFGNQYETIIFATKGRHKRRGHRWSNVWEFSRVSHTKMLHPTQKPTPLIERAILASTDPGDLVVDPYCGSGSLGVAAEITNRRAWLCDVDPLMVRIAAKRLKLDIELPKLKNSETPKIVGSFESPDASEWGIHPEELQIIFNQIISNRGQG